MFQGLQPETTQTLCFSIQEMGVLVSGLATSTYL
jgi:hypothetical protein